MRIVCIGISLVMAAVLLAPTEAADAGKPTGWRNDGNGLYLDATPPLHWSRAGQVMQGLRCQAVRPKNDEAGGTTAAQGVMTEWLVLGPLDFKDPKTALNDALIPNEAEVKPDEGEEAAGTAWKHFQTESHFADFEPAFGKDAAKAVYAHTYLYAPIAGPVMMRARLNYLSNTGLVAKAWLNGKPVVVGNTRCQLDKGWNRLLVKICRLDPTRQFFMKLDLKSVEPTDYASQNVAWTVPLPFSASPPIVVGDKVFVCYEPWFLACLNKSDGKVLWVRSNGYYDAALASERAAHPEIKEAEGLSAKVEALDAAFLKGPPDGAVAPERNDLLKQIRDLMQKVDGKRYLPNPEQVGNAGYAGMSPCSDGTFVYAWFGTGVTACYDMEGRRQWIRVDNAGWQHHGYGGSPVLADGKVIVFMKGLEAFDCKTGEVAWQNTWNTGPMCMYGTWVKAMAGNTPVIVSPSGNCVVLASSGNLVHGTFPSGGCHIASPVSEDGVVYTLSQFGPLNRMALSNGGTDGVTTKNLSPVQISPDQFPVLHMGKHAFAASPICHEGLLYCVDSEGDLIVLDVKKEAIVYQRKLNINALFASTGSLHISGICASLTIAGKYLFVQSNTGVTLVLELGRTYKEVARNKIEETVARGSWDERQASFVINPVFDGNRMFVRSERTLFCICEK